MEPPLTMTAQPSGFLSVALSFSCEQLHTIPKKDIILVCLFSLILISRLCRKIQPQLKTKKKNNPQNQTPKVISSC